MSDWLDGGGRGHVVDVVAIMDSKAAELMWAMVQAGALVSVGTTSDGGALGVTVTLDGRWRREYFREADELVDWLTGGLPFIQEEAARLAASTAQGKRSRGRRSP